MNYNIIYGREVNKIILRLIRYNLRLALSYFKNPFTAIYYVIKMIVNRRQVYGNKKIIKIVSNGQQIFYTSDNPGWPSKAYSNFIINEFKRFKIKEVHKKPLQTAIVSITSRCPLSCAHCYESSYINTGEQLSVDEILAIIAQIHYNGANHIQLSGGEPLARFDDAITIIESSNPSIEFWLLTSGFGLDKEKALRLKKAGLTGAHISLDHWNEDNHNQFRGNTKSFQWVNEAVRNCNEAGIITSLSLTATQAFASNENMTQYWKLAKEWKVSFIRLLEPRAVGRFADQQVSLSKDQIEILEDFYLKSITDKTFNEYPIIDYPGYHQRRTGCLGAGNRYLYVDSVGDYHACPFCQRVAGNAFNMSFDDIRINLQKSKCQAFHASNL